MYPIILAVDDSEDDLDLLRLAFRKEFPNLILKTLNSGRDAISYLSALEKYADRKQYPVPKLVLLDLKMPGKTGFDVLEALPRWPNRPFIVVMSSSSLEQDINEAKRLGADAFHTKPGDFRELCILLRRIISFFVQGNVSAR